MLQFRILADVFTEEGDTPIIMHLWYWLFRYSVFLSKTIPNSIAEGGGGGNPTATKCNNFCYRFNENPDSERVPQRKI